MMTTALADPPQKITSVEGITEYRLDNGLQLLLYPDDSRPTVTVNLTVFVGSRHEGYGEAGMAHLLEHMLFKGTAQHRDIPKLLQDAGAQFNGTTWVDRTNYFETLTASDKNLELAIRLEADRMVNSLIRGEDLASEMTVVRSEFERGENNPRGVLQQRMQAVAFEWHNYGKSTIGNRSDIERVPITNLRDFYRRHYQPDNAMVVVAGKFDEKKALELVQKYFGAIPKSKRTRDKTYTEEPPQDGERTVMLRRVGEVALVSVCYHIPAGPQPDSPAVEILSNILATEPSGRLYKALVETEKAAGVSGYSQSFHDPGLLFMTAEVRTQKGSASIEEVRKTLLETIESIGEKGVTDEEVERARRQILKQRELALSDTSRVAVRLSEWAAQGDWRLFFLHRDRIEKVTKEDVQRVAGQYLRRNNRTVGIFQPTDQPERVPVPSTPSVKDLLAGYKGRKAVSQGEQFEVSYTNIDSRTQWTQIGDLKTALLPKKTRGESVYLGVTLRFGNENNLKGHEEACRMLGDLMARGTKQLSHQQLQDALDKKLARLQTFSTAGELGVLLQTKREHLVEALELLRQVLREPALSGDELAVIQREQLARLEQYRTEPQALIGIKLRRTLSPYPQGDVRYVTTIEERIERLRNLKAAQVQELYQNFIGAENGNIAVVGDFDADEVTPHLNKIFAGWRAKRPYQRLHYTANTKVKAQQLEILTPDKANAVYMAGMQLAMSDSHPDYAALVIGNFIFGGGSLSSRLGNRVRQKEGLSYGVGSQFSADAIDAVGQWRLFAISNPDNTPKVVKVIAEELNRLLADGITEEELERAKQGHLRSQKVRLTRDSALASLLGETLDAKRTLKYNQQLEEKIKGLTVEDVNQALRKQINPKRLVVVTAGDFKK